MERLGRAPASDAVSTGISACRHVSTKANWGRFLDLSVPIASLISDLSLCRRNRRCRNATTGRAADQSHLCVNIRLPPDHCGGLAPVAKFPATHVSDAKHP
jgi:hypothetical protein